MAYSIERSTLERVLKRDRAVTLVGLLVALLLAWTYVIVSDIRMDMDAMAMPEMRMSAHWTPAYFGLMFAMWAIMMVAMMLPSATPMVLLFATEERRRNGASPLRTTTLFASAYLLIWTGFSLVATVLQWQLDRFAQLTPMLAVANVVFAAIVLIAAGIYQFTPMKQACLRGCRSPIEFISRYWSRGPFGIGILHGLYCLGCCWMLMLLLFAGGVMNLLWVALIAAFVLLEKIVPYGKRVSYFAGMVLIAAGLWILYARTAV